MTARPSFHAYVDHKYEFQMECATHGVSMSQVLQVVINRAVENGLDPDVVEAAKQVKIDRINQRRNRAQAD